MSFILRLTLLFVQDIVHARSCPRARFLLLRFWDPSTLMLAIFLVFLVWASYKLRIKTQSL